MWKFCEFLLILVFGLFLFINRCDSRSVNITNTWTLPQEGFSVFYRFFRDQISWFEADAVCQFHHANLVTVEDSMQFDASRDFLKVLDVTEPVWIGLMRTQNSKRFSWPNSKLLPSESGFWAEPIPAIESPLCAVIDPIRDFRWHALRCGGPETASFLCEMSVPSWAEECILRDIPSLTIQYMADTASIKLSKDCGEEGAIHQTCQGKQDRNKIIKELVCKNERNRDLINQNTVKSDSFADITYYKSLQKIKSISTDNNENNDIHIKSPVIESVRKTTTEQNPVEELIEQFNVKEIMQSDEPADKRILGEIPKPVKKTTKKARAFEKKDKSPKKMKASKAKIENTEAPTSLDSMMMGDQPMPEENNEQLEPLPHIKKSLPQDLKHPSNNSEVKEITETPEIVPTVKDKEAVLTTAQDTDSSSTDVQNSPSSTSLDSSISASSAAASDFSSSTPTVVSTTTIGTETKTGSIGHPMHPQQPRMNPITTSPSENGGFHEVHIKEPTDSHFIPPMLLVKSHYSSIKSHSEQQNADNQLEGGSEKLHSEATTIKQDESNAVSSTVDQRINANNVIESGISSGNTTTISPISGTTASSSLPASSEMPGSNSVFESPSTEHQIVEIKIGNSNNPTTFSITTRPLTATEAQDEAITTLDSMKLENERKMNNSNDSSAIKSDVVPSEKAETNKNDHLPPSSDNLINSQTITTMEESISTTASSSRPETTTKIKNKFSNEENFQPFKPNRRRALTKPETTTYLKKILG